MTALTIDSLRAYFGTELPPVLWSPPDPRRASSTAAPQSGAIETAGLDDDEMTPLQVLTLPDVRIEGRLSGDLERKLCLARSREHTARVIRTAGAAAVDLPFCDGSGRRFAQLVEPFLGTAPSAPVGVAASFPAQSGMAALGTGGDAADIAGELRRLGVLAEPARLIGRAFARSVRSFEFTLFCGAQRLAAVVAVIDGPDGRIVAANATDDSGGWMSVADGSPHRIGGAIARACERLPGGGWMP